MRKINLFICYAKEDTSYLDVLKVYINEKQFPKIQVWYDGLISPGNDWDATIREKIDNSDIILLMLSQYFLVSEYIDKVELKRALQRHDAGQSRVIPIFVRKCNLDRYDNITRLQGLPEGMRFFSEMGNDADTHYAILQKKIEAVADDLALEKDIVQSIGQNDNKANAAREIVELRTANRIFLSVPASAEGRRRRREFFFQVEGKIKYEQWPFEITPSLKDLQEIPEDRLEAHLREQIVSCLYSIHIVSDANELAGGMGKLQYDLACAREQGTSFFRKIIWYLNPSIRETLDDGLLKPLTACANFTGLEYEGLFEVIRSLEVERQRQLTLMKKKFSTLRKVIMLYNFTNDHNSELRIDLKTKIEAQEGVSFRFSLPNENLQKEKEDLDICHGGLIFYGAADPQWYLIRQSLLLDAQYTRSKAVCVEEPGADTKIRRDVLKSEFITIKGAEELDKGINDFLNGLDDGQG